MIKTWGPTSLGTVLTRTPNWTFSLGDERFQLLIGDSHRTGNIEMLDGLKVKPGIFWSTVIFPATIGHNLSLDGIPNATASEMSQTVAKAVRQIKVSQLLEHFASAIQPVIQWASKLRTATKLQLQLKGWLTSEFKREYGASKPTGISELMYEPEVKAHIETQPQVVRDAAALWRRDFKSFANEINEAYLRKALQEHKAFFDQVEKSPLTEEQAKAVVCFDNRVLLVASAGSGKTSTMVAKAGYALKKEFFAADKILLLAFNKDAATELGERIKARLEPQGLPADQVVAKTFHAFGLDIIGEVTGKKPSVAPWLEGNKETEALLELIDGLKDSDGNFRMNWDLFRVVLGQDLPQFGKEEESPESWDRERSRAGFWTLKGDTVRSRGEQMIANWLFYNGVNYEYESPYKIDTADAQHQQYCPDFYLVDADVYLEHWAVDADGNPPPEFRGYKESMEWKRKLHATHSTTLLETTMADLWSGKAFRYLNEELTKLGIKLDPNPDRPANGRRPIENPRLARTFRTFLTHVKSNQLSISQLRQRLDSGVAGQFQYRHQMFLNLFERVWEAWEARLKQEGYIDFEDMLRQAADYVESGQWKSPYELVMVDEFQDVSQARARLISGLIKEPGCSFFAVGDDWQSINRFAGSDLAVMTDFESRFGEAVTLKLETTFRCPQSLCDISSSFVQKNPKQLKKRVRSAKPDVVNPVRIIQVNDESKIRAAVIKCVQEIAETSSSKDVGKRPKIYVLGRYHKERQYFPEEAFYSGAEVEFVTAHASKGLEADHVIIPWMVSDTLGFPCRIEDDPVLQLAMPGGDTYEDAEERRLFYVALTRARSTVSLITLAHKQSSFIAELVRDYKLEITDVDGAKSSAQICPICKDGFLVPKNGRFGPFLGCSRFPKCEHTQKISETLGKTGQARRKKSRKY